MPEVDLFIGTGALSKTSQALTQKPKKKSFLPKPTFLYNETTPRILSTPPFTAYLKIAEGCSNACTFCTVPKIRGRYRSRKLRSVLEEAERLADQGVQELILIAQDTTAYGRDLRDGTNLENLLKNLVKVGGLRWIRILYSYPKADHFPDELLELMAQEEKICSYLDLPIQHIDDEILKRMGRRAREPMKFEIFFQKIRTFLPEVSLRSSLIVGFPGERKTNSKHSSTLWRRFSLITSVPLNTLPEEGTPASRLPHSIPERVKEERLRTLMEIQKKISLKKYQEMVGAEEGGSRRRHQPGRGVLRGRLQTQAPEEPTALSF